MKRLKAPQFAQAWVATGAAAFSRAGRHNLALVAAGVAFFCLLALFPTLSALVAIYGLVRDPSDI
jgi:membrane protein